MLESRIKKLEQSINPKAKLVGIWRKDGKTTEEMIADWKQENPNDAASTRLFIFGWQE